MSLDGTIEKLQLKAGELSMHYRRMHPQPPAPTPWKDYRWVEAEFSPPDDMQNANAVYIDGDWYWRTAQRR